jgi:hypothetical protein
MAHRLSVCHSQPPPCQTQASNAPGTSLTSNLTFCSTWYGAQTECVLLPISSLSNTGKQRTWHQLDLELVVLKHLVWRTHGQCKQQCVLRAWAASQRIQDLKVYARAWACCVCLCARVLCMHLCACVCCVHTCVLWKHVYAWHVFANAHLPETSC